MTNDVIINQNEYGRFNLLNPSQYKTTLGFTIKGIKFRFDFEDDVRYYGNDINEALNGADLADAIKDAYYVMMMMFY